MPYGKLTHWNDERGFGFIRSDAPPCDATFAHIIEFEKAGVFAPKRGDAFSYRVGEDHRSGKARAVDIAPVETFDMAAEVEAQIG